MFRLNDKIIRCTKKGLYAYSMMYSDGYTFESQIHPFYEILYLNAGRMLYNVEGRDYILSEGDMIFTLPYEMHSFSFPEHCRYERQFFHIYPEFIEIIKNIVPDISFKKPGMQNCIQAADVSRYGLDAIFRGLEECSDPRSPETDALIFSYAVQMLAKLHLIITKEDTTSAKAPDNKNVRNILKYIDKHYMEHIGLSEIAENMYMDKSYIGRLFKQHTGVSIMLYVNMKRIVLAKNLILAGGDATEIFFECGFKDYTTFFRAFKRYVGVSPGEFKKMNG